MNESELTHCESSHTEDRHQTYRANTMRKRIKKIERTYNNKKKKEIYIMYIETHTHTHTINDILCVIFGKRNQS